MLCTFRHALCCRSLPFDDAACGILYCTSTVYTVLYILYSDMDSGFLLFYV